MPKAYGTDLEMSDRWLLASLKKVGARGTVETVVSLRYQGVSAPCFRLKKSVQQLRFLTGQSPTKQFHIYGQQKISSS
jgi:hypothetical protein